eukprot:GHVU01212730.1.p1 GENE.GHVU01212730.1~~GHVU01212730.1.p1  ORF type:complete len:161 (+),score=11.31 GHVU01212730.1:304-786(+)
MEVFPRATRLMCVVVCVACLPACERAVGRLATSVGWLLPCISLDLLPACMPACLSDSLRLPWSVLPPTGAFAAVRLLTQLAAAATSPQAATGTSQQSSSAPGNSAAGGQPGHVYVSEEALELLSKRVLDFAADVVRLSASLSPSISLTRAHSVTLAGPVR